MKLLIVESPAKSKTISKYLGKDYEVTASVGHIRDLPKSNKDAVDIEAGFVPHYEISKGKEKIISEIIKLAKKADEIYLAMDPDREGEAIAWHLSKIISGKLKGENKEKIKRITYNEITKEAIKESLKHPREIDQNLRRAQEARRVLDRLVGYDLSGLIWKKVRYGLSAGRVQSPALRILMEKEREIRAFKSEDYFVISAKLQVSRATLDTFMAVCVEETRDKSRAEEIYKTAKNGKWFVKNVSETEVKRTPRPPFITSTLQQTASTRLGMSPKWTMATAQKLYEAGLITYMRTDSLNLATVAITQAKSVITQKFGAQNHQSRNFKTKSKNAQEAHEAIRPTDLKKENAGRTNEQKKLYRLIWQRIIASQMIDAKIMRTKITAITGKTPDFNANGSRIIKMGWLMADPEARGEEINLPKVKSEEKLNLLSLNKVEKQTQPPNRYTEAGLIKELEKRGIGRPSTYASTINTIIQRSYVEKDGKTLKPTDTGDVVSTFLEKNFEKYISDTFTAEMENELDDIASGKRKYEPTLREFYEPFLKEVKEKENMEKITNLGDAPSEFKCPTCGADMIIKLGRGGKFLSCQKFPDCKGLRSIDGKEIKEAEPIGKDPKTGLPVFVLDGRFGPYVQLGELVKGKEKPRRASVPKDKDPDSVTLEEALVYLSLPRVLGKHPETKEAVTASIGRFGPYIVHQKDFRSLKKDDVYTITLDRALEILKEPKKFGRRGRKTT